MKDRGRTQQQVTFTSVELVNFKAFGRFSVALQSMNTLAGPNNCGKRTLLGVFPALEVGLRRGRSRNPEVSNMLPDEIPPDLVELVQALNRFRQRASATEAQIGGRRR
jgi:hypothetical protein